MFQRGFFSRILHFRKRRPAKDNTSSAEVAKRSSLGPPLPQSRHSVSSQPEPTPSDLPTQGTPTHIIVVAPDPDPDPDPDQSASPATLIQPLGDSVGPQIYLDGVLLTDSPPRQTQPQTHIDADTSPCHVTSQVPAPDIEDALESPLSPCSTLIAHEEEVDTAGRSEPEPPVPVPVPVTLEVNDPAPDRVIAAAPDAQTDSSTSGVRFDPGSSGMDSGRSRHKSLFNPQLVQASTSRFSILPTRSGPSLTPKMNVGDGRRESKRASLMPIGSGSSTRREKRQSRWSREMSKPETQEVLRALSGI